jgi:hypothetical protein
LIPKPGKDITRRTTAQIHHEPRLKIYTSHMGKTSPVISATLEVKAGRTESLRPCWAKIGRLCLKNKNKKRVWECS